MLTPQKPPIPLHVEYAGQTRFALPDGFKQTENTELIVNGEKCFPHYFSIKDCVLYYDNPANVLSPLSSVLLVP